MQLRHSAPAWAILLPIALLTGCANQTSALVQAPLSAPPVPPPTYIERVHTGAIFQANAPMATLFSAERKPRSIGDTLKIDIAESLSATTNTRTDASRENKVASKGPGSSSDALGGALKSLLNLDATASGSDSFKGAGSAENTSKFNGRLAASVVNVLPNGNLLVAGERSIAFNRGLTTLRFSGVVNPSDIKAGNIVASGDVVDARLEAVGGGDVDDTASRSWLQRVLTKSLQVW